VLRLLAAVVLLAAAGAWPQRAQAQGAGWWSVQTVALRDLREAQGTTDSLKRHGFDAYTEFAMDSGLQFVRVRVGCFTSREAAEAMADALRGRVTETAVPVELTPGAPTQGCVDMVVGFLKPSSWDAVTRAGAVPAFQVQVAGLEAHVVHTGERWRVLQDGEPLPALDAALASERFSQAQVGGALLVRQETPGGGLVLCPGRLLASVGRVAITELGDALVACSLEPMREP